MPGWGMGAGSSFLLSWSGLSGQGPSLTSHQGPPNEEQATYPPPWVQVQGGHGSHQWAQDPPADRRCPWCASHPGQPVEEAASGGCQRAFLFGEESKNKEDCQAKESELFQQIGRLQMKPEWLKKTLSSFEDQTYGISLIMRILISRSVANVNRWDCLVQPSIPSQFQCGIRRC